MKLKELLQSLHNWAPPSFQEGYDNSGLLVGDDNQEITGVLVSLDCTESIIQEAKEKECNVVIAHHPIVFSGLKRFIGSNYVERTVIDAIKNDIAIIAIHTNLDHINSGVNAKIGTLLGIQTPTILKPMKGHLLKVQTYVPRANTEDVAGAMFSAGAGNIGSYESCSFRNSGTGTFKAGDNANPHVGEIGKIHFEEEDQLMVVVHKHKLNAVVSAMKKAHPYEEVAYDVFELQNLDDWNGAGMYGELPESMGTMEFLAQVKETFKCGVVKYTNPHVDQIKKVAWCGGAGSFLLNDAKKSGADIFITGDYKYHQFFDAENEIIIADIGHFESEQFTKELIADFLGENFSTFAIHLSEVNTNPVNYL
jgi:dinuclear metal center YbgI/SA1388 family protein